MIRALFSGVAGAWIARNVERGDIPEKFAVPLTLLATRIPTPVLLAGALGYGIYRWKQEAHAFAAHDINPETSAPSSRTAKKAAQRKQLGRKAAKPTSARDEADV